MRLQVQDSAGRRLDRAAPYHPGGREERLAVRLRPGLEATYAASYRVISEDGHPVVKRITFRVRPPMSTAGSGAGPVAVTLFLLDEFGVARRS